MDYEITDYISPEEYMEMRKLVGWSEFPLEQAVEGLKHSAHICVFRKDDKVIGIARVLTDHGYVVYIADVIVRPDYQGQGWKQSEAVVIWKILVARENIQKRLSARMAV